MRIRPATPDDEKAVRACARAAYAPYIPLIGREPAPINADIASQIAAGQVHVAEKGGELVGYIAFHPQGDHMLLESVAVLSARAGQGIGRALIAHCETAARIAGLNAVHLYTNAKMTENLSPYPHLGYIETGRAAEDGFDRVFFRKRL